MVILEFPYLGREAGVDHEKDQGKSCNQRTGTVCTGRGGLTHFRADPIVKWEIHVPPLKSIHISMDSWYYVSY